MQSIGNVVCGIRTRLPGDGWTHFRGGCCDSANEMANSHVEQGVVLPERLGSQRKIYVLTAAIKQKEPHGQKGKCERVIGSRASVGF